MLNDPNLTCIIEYLVRDPQTLCLCFYSCSLLTRYLLSLPSRWLLQKNKKNKSVADDGLKGIKICRGARVISQLLFADDTILLFEVSSSQAIYCERFVEQLHVSDGSTYYMKAIY